MNEEKKVPFKWEYGEETISLQLGMYANNQRLYIGMITHTEDGAEPFADMTVNLPGYSLDPGEAFISGDISKDLLRFIKENKLGKVLPYQVQSGYGKYSAVPRGNLTRIDNALAQMPQRLEAAKAQLDNLYQQQAAAKEEVGKPFLYEEELKSKNARLVELDTLLNIDGKGPAHDEAVVAKSTRPSVLDHLKRPVPPRSTDKKPKQHEEVR